MTRTTTSAAERLAIILTSTLSVRLTQLHIRDAQVELRQLRSHLEIAVNATPDARVIALVPTAPTAGRLIRVALDTTSPHLQEINRDTDGPYTAAAAMADAIAYVLTATYLGHPGAHRQTA